MNQISIFELMNKEPEPQEIPQPAQGERVYTIPDDVWETRCKYCMHKQAEQNIPVPISVIHKYAFQSKVPCRILAVALPDRMPGECLSFAPHNVYGICATCEYNNPFVDDFCRKPHHAEQHRVFYGQDYGGDEKKRDYWGRHCLSTCADYSPRQEDLIKMEGERNESAGGL